MLPPTSATVSVAFYADDPRQLAEQHEIIGCLLTLVPKPRQGTYHAPMAALCNLMLQPPYRVVRALQVRVFLAEELWCLRLYVLRCDFLLRAMPWQ